MWFSDESEHCFDISVLLHVRGQFLEKQLLVKYSQMVAVLLGEGGYNISVLDKI
jgi:hypothetical protein